MKLFVLRHAKVLIPDGLCYGVSECDSDTSHTQACAARLAPMLPTGAPIWTSPLRRAYQLAQAVHGLRPDLQAPLIDPRLSEMNFGHWEMTPWNDIPKSAFDAWTADFAQHRFGGEQCVQEVLEAVEDALGSAKALAQTQACEGLVWVTHAGVVSALRHLRAGQGARMARADDWPAPGLVMGEMLCLDL
jgi:alpha-ribazole phosphatase